MKAIVQDRYGDLISGFAALQGLRDEGQVQPGQQATGISSWTARPPDPLAAAAGLTPKGTLVIVGGEGGGRWLGGFDRNLRAVALSRLVGQRLRMLSSKPGQADLQMLRELIEAGAGASSPCEASATAVQVPGVCRPQHRPRQGAPDNKQGGYYWAVYPPSRTSIVPVM